MQLITLNIWGGYVHEPLLKFIAQHSETDIFCLQEVYHQAPETISTEDKKYQLNIFSEIEKLLPNHTGIFKPVVNEIYGIALFIKNSVDLLNEGEVHVHHNHQYPGKGPTHSRNLQWIECRVNEKIYAILNFHGLWNGKGKKDSPERIAQSQRICEFMNTLNIPKILCGDFNLRPDTESLKLLETNMVNLIKTHNITSTRTSLYPKEEKFADYILLSPEINIDNFTVLPNEVSDHAPLLLDFE